MPLKPAAAVEESTTDARHNKGGLRALASRPCLGSLLGKTPLADPLTKPLQAIPAACSTHTPALPNFPRHTIDPNYNKLILRVM